MADTREFYLVCNDGTIFGSDPTTIYKYLDMSDEGDLNDKAATVIYNFKNQFRVIDDYEIQITLTFNNRAERELFAMTNIDNIWAFGATGKIDKSVIYTKRAMVAGFEFLDNDYTNAIQSILTLKVSGQWQSDLVKYTVPSPDDNGDGTKKYYAGELYTTAKDSSVGANLIIRSNLTSGYISTSTGTIMASNNDFHTDNYMPTNGSTIFTISSPDYTFVGSTNSYIIKYDKDKKLIGSQQLTSGTQTLTGTNVVYIRLSIQFVNEGGTSGKLSDWLANHRYKFESGSSSLLSNLTSGYISTSSGGVIASNNDFHTDNYIATGGSTIFIISSPDYTFVGSTNSYIIKYDKDKKLIGSQQLTSGTQTLTGTNVVYIRLSIQFVNEGGTSGKLSDWLANHRYQLEKGGVATAWLPNTSDPNYSYLCEANYQYYKADENINQYKYGSTNYSNTIQLDIEDNQFIIYFVLNEGKNKVTISNDTDSVTLTHTAFNNGELVPLGSEGIDYSLDSRDTVDAFSLWKDGTLLSDDWTVDNVEDYFTLLSILDTIKESEVSIIAQGPEGATLPYTIYTYSKHDFI